MIKPKPKPFKSKKQIKATRYSNLESQQTLGQLEKEIMALVIYNLNHIHKLYLRWKSSKNQNFINTLNDPVSIWLHWLHFDIQSYNSQFQGRPQKLDNHPEKLILKKIKSDEQFWTSVNPFEGITPLNWRVRFTVNARTTLLKQTDENKLAALRLIIIYSLGYLNMSKYNYNQYHSKVIKQGPCRNMVFFSGDLKDNLSIVFCSEFNQIPETQNGKFVSFCHIHHLKVVDFCYTETEALTTIDKYLKKIKKSPETYVEEYEHPNSYKHKSISDNFRNVGKLILPFPEFREYLSDSAIENYFFDSEKKRWVLKENADLKEIQNYNKSLGIIKRLSTKNAGNAFVEILKRIPKFSLMLTEEQNKAIRKAGHVVILGRSGTGKTTSAVLRMFASEILFKNKIKPKSRQLCPSDIKRVTSLHCMFVTASPVLTHEVKRFYSKMKTHLCDQLQERIDKNKEKIETENNLEEIKDVEYHESDSDSIECEYSDSDDENYGPFSMNSLRDEDFPVFYTFRRLVLMIDASIRYPFFPRDLHGQIIGSGKNSDWTSEYVSSMKISKTNKPKQYLNSSSSSDEEDYNESMKTENLFKHFEKSRQRKTETRTFEVDFKIFKERFWPTVKYKTQLSPLLIWTEITAYIKGSGNSWFHGGYLPKYVYANRNRKQTFLTNEKMLELWDIFYDYECWKRSYSAYDFQDIINHILSSIRYSGYTGVPIHYMMVDEVQDLTNASISLLLSICKEQIVFSGDTAQTIAKGVGFRFSDLGNLFSECGLDIPEINKLTINFRTHNQVLGLANSVVSLLEALFPQTIDFMAKEKSYQNGPLPIVVNASDVNDLVKVVFGIQSKNQDEIQFGCNQVIIVRNQESKSKVPAFLSHALCLTVFESKGLEFEDVILFNFFTDSDLSSEKWKILQKIVKIDEKRENPENLENSEIDSPTSSKFKCQSDFDASKYGLLCTELKHLYVSITRPKQNLIIFDESPEKRRYIQELWSSLDLINIVELDHQKAEKIESFIKSSDLNSWKLQGERMMAHKFYDQASKCFSVCGEKLLERKADAFFKATQANALLSKWKLQLNEIKNLASKAARQQAKVKIKEKILAAEESFVYAADELLRVSEESQSKSLQKHAAQCYASARQYLKAGRIFEDIGFKGQAAECFWQAGEFEKAGEIFDEKGDYLRSIECYSRTQEWDKLVHCLYRHKSRIPADELQKYVYKYIPVALEAVIPKSLPIESGGYIKKLLEEQTNIIIEESEEDD